MGEKEICRILRLTCSVLGLAGTWEVIIFLYVYCYFLLKTREKITKRLNLKYLHIFGVMVFRKNCHLSVSVIFSIYSSKKEGEFLCLENTVRVYTSMRKQ